MSILTPREIVSELDKFIVGQEDAKRMVAVAIRNRWRRQRLPAELRDEVSPKNIIMIGPTGVGKTEIARRLAKLCGSPFIKVEATKYTEVGYVGRDVESMVRDLMEISVNLVLEEERRKVSAKAKSRAEDRLLDLLLPRPASPSGYNYTPSASEQNDNQSTREKLRQLWRSGGLNDRDVEMDVEVQSGPQIEMLTMPGMEDMGSQFKDIFSKIMPSQHKRRRIKVPEAFELLAQEEAERLIDQDQAMILARERAEQTGIIFIDELDKITSSQAKHGGGVDVSREGVQRDLLPIVEGSAVKTKYGMIRTDHILFIAAGAFHYSKPSDLIPELQGRFPLRTELMPLNKKDFVRILTEPDNALTKQYVALLGTEGVTIDFTADGISEIAGIAEYANQELENIGARRLYTVLEKVLSELSFVAPDRSGATITIDKDYVTANLGDTLQSKDLSRYIL